VIEEERIFWLILTAEGAEMRSKVEQHSEEAKKAVRDIRRATRRQYSAKEKVGIVIAGLRGEDSIAELCRKEGINQNLYYRWSKDFLEAGKKRLAGDTARGDQRRSEGSAGGDSPAQGVAGRADDGEPPLQPQFARQIWARTLRGAVASRPKAF
jgi:transposase-like protein